MAGTNDDAYSPLQVLPVEVAVSRHTHALFCCMRLPAFVHGGCHARYCLSRYVQYDGAVRYSSAIRNLFHRHRNYSPPLVTPTHTGGWDGTVKQLDLRQRQVACIVKPSNQSSPIRCMAIGTVEEPPTAEAAQKKKKKGATEAPRDPTVLYIAHGTGTQHTRLPSPAATGELVPSIPYLISPAPPYDTASIVQAT